MPSTLNNKRRPNPQRYKAVTMRQFPIDAQRINANIATAEVAMSVLTLTFDRPVLLGPGFTRILTDVAVDEVSSTQTAANAVEITYSGSVAGATEVLMPNSTPNLRTATGGFVQSGTFPV
jgi:hypothetical protein